MTITQRIDTVLVPLNIDAPVSNVEGAVARLVLSVLVLAMLTVPEGQAAPISIASSS